MDLVVGGIGDPETSRGVDGDARQSAGFKAERERGWFF